jgi:cystathionine beta-lyase/cystathionine gamma-synthase
MTHAAVPVERRLELGIKDTLIRLSIGIEDVKDLLADLEQAFASLPSRAELLSNLQAQG